jgi:hypothetical protein
MVLSRAGRSGGSGIGVGETEGVRDGEIEGVRDGEIEGGRDGGIGLGAAQAASKNSNTTVCFIA